jgi:hypothetical protein
MLNPFAGRGMVALGRGTVTVMDRAALDEVLE